MGVDKKYPLSFPVILFSSKKQAHPNGPFAPGAVVSAGQAASRVDRAKRFHILQPASVSNKPGRKGYHNPCENRISVRERRSTENIATVRMIAKSTGCAVSACTITVSAMSFRPVISRPRKKKHTTAVLIFFFKGAPRPLLPSKKKAI